MKFCAAALVLTAALTLPLAPAAADAQQAPRVPRIGVLLGNSQSSHSTHVEALRQGLRERGYPRSRRPPAEVRTVDAFEGVFAAIVKARPDALLVIADRLLLSNRTRIVAFAAQHRLPAMYALDMFRRAGRYIDRILKGAHPGDLPMEQPAKLELVINGKTAQTLGLTIPPSLRLQADRVIE